MPVYNGESTIAETLKSLLAQSKKFDELIVVNDASPDNSKEVAEKYLAGKIEYRLINHEKNAGLARSYNEAILRATGDLIVTLHQDVILMPDALEKLIAPFSDSSVVAAGHKVIYLRSAWKKYTFWQKCYFARFVGKETAGVNGQFDCFRKVALEKAGLFDAHRFRSAGEDGDMVYRLSKLGKIAQTEAKIEHLQNSSPDFGPKDIIRKQKQHSEAQGALLALGRIKGLANILKVFFRELLVLTLFIPYLNILSLMSIIIYSVVYTGLVYSSEYKNPRILSLPFLNIYLLFVSFFYSLRGFIYKKQTL